jgi:hypothetical protein
MDEYKADKFQRPPINPELWCAETGLKCTEIRENTFWDVYNYQAGTLTQKEEYQDCQATIASHLIVDSKGKVSLKESVQ